MRWTMCAFGFGIIGQFEITHVLMSSISIVPGGVDTGRHQHRGLRSEFISSARWRVFWTLLP